MVRQMTMLDLTSIEAGLGVYSLRDLINGPQGTNRIYCRGIYVCILYLFCIHVHIIIQKYLIIL